MSTEGYTSFGGWDPKPSELYTDEEYQQIEDFLKSKGADITLEQVKEIYLKGTCVTYQHKPWDKATVQDNNTPFRVGDRVKVELLNRTTGEPEKCSWEDKVFTINADESGNLGIAGFDNPESWFSKLFSPLTRFSHDVRFTLVERIE